MIDRDAPTRSTAPWDQPRKGSTVTVTVSNPRTATDEELLAALEGETPEKPPMLDPAVEYVNWRNDDGRVCFGVSWRNRSYRPPAAGGEQDRAPTEARG